MRSLDGRRQDGYERCEDQRIFTVPTMRLNVVVGVEWQTEELEVLPYCD